jgi:hypothetical protein
MNLIELENLVKGAPDEYLTKEVKQPTGKIPPFLALSEIQRRKDMRDRYQAQKNEGPKPTIADQLTGGGIGSLPGAQGAPVPTPSATGVPSAGAPPVAAGAAPMPTPPGQPQGFAAGGIVKLASDGVVPRGSEVQRRKPYEYNVLEAFKAQSPAYYNALKGVADVPLGAYYQANNMLNAVGNYPIEMVDSIRKHGIRNSSGEYAMHRHEDNPSLIEQLKARDAARLSEASAIAASPAPDYMRRAGAPPEAPVSAPMATGSGPLPAPAGGASASGGAGSYTMAPGGIAAFDPAEALAGSVPAAGMPNPYNLSPEELSYQEFMKNDENFKLPEALSYQGFIDEAVGEEQAIRAEAKKQALGAALVQLGAGLAAGDMAKGLTTAGAESRDILSQGRREASAQKALAQQFKLRGMEGEREQQMKTMEIEQQRAMSLAQFAGGNRKDAESRAMQIMEMKQRAADRAANLSASLASQAMTRDRYALEAKKDRVQLRSELLRATIGEPPSAKTMADYQESIAFRLDPNTGKLKPGQTLPPSPMDVYRKYAAQVAPEVDRQVAEVFEGTGYTPSAPVAPVSNPPQEGWGITLVTGKK